MFLVQDGDFIFELDNILLGQLGFCTVLPHVGGPAYPPGGADNHTAPGIQDQQFHLM